MPYFRLTGLELPDDTATVWRYMEFSKYVSMLAMEGIFFVRCDKFEDKWDSVLPEGWIATMNRKSLTIDDGRNLTLTEWYKEMEIPSRPVSCWTVNTHENEGMWSRYTPTGAAAVAIRSTVAGLRECFSSCTENVLVGLVKYGEHSELADPKFSFVYRESEAPPVRLNTWYVPQFFKRKNFAWEEELRAMASVSTSPPIEYGHSLKVGIDGLRTLIRSVHLKPGAQPWFKQVVESVNERYGLGTIPVSFSEIDAAPP